jgi:hypothetical protein
MVLQLQDVVVSLKLNQLHCMANGDDMFTAISKFSIKHYISYQLIQVYYCCNYYVTLYDVSVSISSYKCVTITE